jgi:hypothetical protein
MNTSKPTPAAWKAVYTISERGGRTNWVRIGTAFMNRDGSWNVKFDAFPVNGTLHIRDADPKEPEPAGESVPLHKRWSSVRLRKPYTSGIILVKPYRARLPAPTAHT